MDLTTATPVEIDTALATAYGKTADLNSRAHRAHQLAKMLEETLPGTEETYVPERSKKRHVELFAEVRTLRGKVSNIYAEEINPREAEWERRGRWTRYYLVDNTNGHVHKDMHCGTCFPTTRYAWLVEQSGMSAEDLVELAGEKACTVCFPWAPVDVLKQKTRLEAPERKAARLEREAKKAAAAAKKAAKAIANPDGTPLEVFDWRVPERQRQTRKGLVTEPAHDRFETIATLAAARSWLADQYDTWQGSGGTHRDVNKVAEAIAHKEGKTTEVVIDEAKKRAARRK
jgi:hypothetical protein